MKSTWDKTLHAAVLMHQAWDVAQVLLASTPEQAMEKATAFHRAAVLEYKNPEMSDDEWVEDCWEQGEWTIERAEVNS